MRKAFCSTCGKTSLILLFLLSATTAAHPDEYLCDENIFRYRQEVTATWKLELPVDEDTIIFPLVLYQLYDPITRFL